MTVRTSPEFRATIAAGLERIREEFDVPGAFPSGARVRAVAAVGRSVTDERRDLTAMEFVTLDPAGATDLDQAFTLERVGDDIRLHYAIADVGWFVKPDTELDHEAWRRGTTVYLPDAKAPLYPPVMSEGGASLLPDGPRPAIVLTTDVGPDGEARLHRVERAIVRSRAKLAYETVEPGELPPLLAEIAARVNAAEEQRGAGRVEFPEQEVVADGAGGYRLAFRERRPSEDQNAALSLATNLAVAALLYREGTGVFRTMAGPEERELRMLRRTAAALDLSWPAGVSLTDFQRHLPATPAAAAFLLAVRRAGGGAGYEPYRPGEVPWHAAIAATYVHATAPLRRLADRYVLEAALACQAGIAVPGWVSEAFEALPEAMRRADTRSAKVDRAVVDLVEAATLRGHEGEVFAATVTDIDERGARIQLDQPAVVARLDADQAGPEGFEPGRAVRVRLELADPEMRRIVFAVDEGLPKP